MTTEYTTADLEVLAQAFPHTFPSKGVQFSARRALRRIHEILERSPRDIPAGDPISLYRKTVGPTVSKRTGRDETSALKHLVNLPALSRETIDRIWHGEASLADTIIVIQAQNIGDEAKRIAGALTRFAAYHHKQPGDIPAIERTIGKDLERLQAADFGLSLRSYRTFCSRLRRAVRLVDRNAHVRISAEALNGAWRELSDRVHTEHPELRGDLAKLWPLITYCWNRDINPTDVDDHVIADHKCFLERQDVDGPFDRARAVVYAWERLQKHVTDWPPQTLSRLYANGQAGRISARMHDLPPTVQALWADFESAMQDRGMPDSSADLVEDPEDPLADFQPGREDTHIKGYKASSLDSQRAHWLICVKTHFEETGRYPEQLSEVTALETLKKVIRDIAARDRIRAEKAGKQPARKTTYRKAIVSSALAWARYENCAIDHIEALEALRDHLDPYLKAAPKINAKGKKVRTWVEDQMGERHKERLTQFRNLQHAMSWHTLPERLVSIAKPRLERSHMDAEASNLVLVALVHRILRCVPMRRMNLAGLRIGGPRPQVALPFHGKGEGRIEIDWLEVKNKRAITVHLDESTVALMRYWIRDLRPHLMARVGSNPGNPYLFPARGDGHRDGNQINTRFRDINEQHGGFLMNLHLARHLTAKIILDEDWSQIELVRQLLGHGKLKTTISFYAEAQEMLAQKRWHEILEESRRKIEGALKQKGRAA